MGGIGSKIEAVRCSKCKNIVNAKVLSEYVGIPNQGITFNKIIKLNSHKKNGFFSSKCDGSGSELDASFWYPSDKIRKTRCVYCKRSVTAYVLKKYSKISRVNKYVDQTTNTIVMKVLYHNRGIRKCSGIGHVTKECRVDLIDTIHK